MNKRQFKNYTEIKKIADERGSVTLNVKQDHYVICQYASRGGISNFITDYELIDQNISVKLPLDLEHGTEILNRIANGSHFADSLIFYKNKPNNLSAQPGPGPSDMENKFTSTGIKFWRHQNQLLNYRAGNHNTIISTHISPEGSCNLKCPYCSVTYRDTHSRIPLEIIKDYVVKLKSRGLRAVILTGGGEPTSYKYFNDLVRWLYGEDLSIAVVTNGSKIYWNKVDPEVCQMFDWVRVSINIFDGWETNIRLPMERFNLEKTLIGCSMVYTMLNESSPHYVDDVELLKRVALVADGCQAKYIRLLPNCLLSQDNLMPQHAVIDALLQKVSDPRFFHQFKVHRAPQSDVCHQSYFRPYLSEEVHKATGLPGTVYPCDSVVLNDAKQFYSSEYQLCHASEILEYLDRRISQNFNPREQCQGCVHTNNIDMLEQWKQGKVDRFWEFTEPLIHENFV
jgi:organic radical activating enzyme